MAKTEIGKIKIRFFEVEVEGSNETLLESVRSAAALANRGHSSRPIKSLPPMPVTNGGTQGVSEQDADVMSDVSPEGSELEEQAGSRAKKTRTYTSQKVVDIDLTGGPQPFAEFVQSKNPGDTIKKFLVCATWLKDQRNISIVDADHIWTCFRHMQWGVQRDMAQPLRDGARNGYFKKVSKGKYEITHIGLDAVTKMKSASSSA